MKTSHASLYGMPQLPFALVGILTVCLTILAAGAQTNYWGSAGSFNGGNGYLQFGATPPLSSAWTAEFWVNRQDSTNTAATLFDDGITSLRLEQFGGARHVGFTRYGVADYTFNYIAPTNSWVHLAFVSDTITTRLYVNGVAQDTNSHVIALPLRQFGATTNSSRPNSAMKGMIDEVRVWNVARSAAELQVNLSRSLPDYPASLVGYWKFDEASGVVSHDATTNHHDGTLVNELTRVVSTVPFPFAYTTNGGAITITSYTGPGTGVVIPSTINGLPVTSIAGSAFFDCFTLTSITIPEGVTSIGDYAFFNCFSLTSVTIPDSVTSIVSDAFANCTGLLAINVGPNNPAYSSLDGVLFNKNRTTLIECPSGKSGNYDIPDSVTVIGNYAFFYCGSLTGVTIPAAVTSIGDMAFASCGSLQSLTLPWGLSSIGYAEFVNCYALTSITIPGSVTNIGNYAFASCWSLAGIYCLGNAPSLADAAVFANIHPTVYYRPGTTGWATFNAHSGLSPVVLWDAQVQRSAATFGFRTNHFGFTINGNPNIPIVVEACTNLVAPVWTTLQTCSLTNGTIYFSDPENRTNHAARFYQVRWP